MADDILGNVKFWMQVVGDLQQTIVCPPDLESRVKCRVDAMGIGGMVTVQASRACPPDKLILIDTAAIEAANRQALQRDRYERQRPPGGMEPWE